MTNLGRRTRSHALPEGPLASVELWGSGEVGAAPKARIAAPALNFVATSHTMLSMRFKTSSGVSSASALRPPLSLPRRNATISVDRAKRSFWIGIKRLELSDDR
jgi:hypothetical protein